MPIIAKYDHNRHTCIEVSRTKGKVVYIPYDISEGLKVLKMNEAQFDDYYREIPGYPIKRACDLYLSFVRTVGATKEALSILAAAAEITPQQLEALSKKSIHISPVELPVKVDLPRAEEQPKTGKGKTKKVEAVIAEVVKKEVKKTGKQAVQDPKTAAAIAKLQGRQLTATGRLKQLLMEGGRTMAEVWAIIDGEFELGPTKKYYPSWYHKDMTKKGLNPPPFK